MHCTTEDLEWVLQVGGIATHIHDDKTKVYRGANVMFTEDKHGIPYQFDPSEYANCHWDVIPPQQLRNTPPSDGLEVVPDNECGDIEW